MAKRKSSSKSGRPKKPPKIPSYLFDDYDVEERLFSKGKAQEIWNWAWINAEEGAWTPETHRRHITDGLSREFFFSEDMENPRGRAAVRIAEAAVLAHHRGSVLALANQRAGFTYGYQWSNVQPDSYLKFPIEGMSRDERRIRVYPVKLTEVTKNTPIDLLIEQPDESGANRWHHVFLDGGQRIHPDEDTEARLRVALDWHEENGYSVQPFVQDAWMPKWLHVQNTAPRNPTEWMDRAATEWLNRWKGVGELYWLDTKIEDREQWDAILFEDLGGRTQRYTVMNLDVWGNARDGYETNDEHRVGEIEVVEGGDVVQELVNAGYLNAANSDGIEIEDYGDSIVVQGPEIPVDEAPERTAPEGDLPESFADEAWQYGWDCGLNTDFHSQGEDGEFGTARNRLQHIDVRNHWTYSAWRELAEHNGAKGKEVEGVVERLMDEVYDIARAAFDAAVEASRNDSRIPLFRLDLVEE